jgi:hypothetical protein
MKRNGIGRTHHPRKSEKVEPEVALEVSGHGESCLSQPRQKSVVSFLKYSTSDLQKCPQFHTFRQEIETEWNKIGSNLTAGRAT